MHVVLPFLAPLCALNRCTSVFGFKVAGGRMEMPTNVASSATTNFAPGMQSVGFDNAQEAPSPSQDHNDQAKNYLSHIHTTNVIT